MITLVDIAVLVLLVVVYFRSVTPVEVESATVTTAYPSQLFSELAFGFILNFTIIMKSFAFALIMGLTGGCLLWYPCGNEVDLGGIHQNNVLKECV